MKQICRETAMARAADNTPVKASGDASGNGGVRRILSLVLAFVLTQAVFWAQVLILPGVSRAALFGEFTIKDEKEYGEKFNVLVRSRLPLIQDPEVVGYVQGIVDKLQAGMRAQFFPFTVSVLRHNAVNAFATPGGYVFVHTGLIMAMRSESELAGVIAHELAHVTQRHIAGRIEAMQPLGILSIVGALAGAFLGGEAGAGVMAGTMAASQAAMLKYSRSDESEADQVGMNYMVAAGYDPKGMVGAFEVIGKKQWMMGSTIPAYLSTHPDVNERIRTLSQRLASLPPDKRVRKVDNSRFFRVQALVRARYGDLAPAARAFEEQLTHPETKCIAYMGLGILASRQNRILDATKAFDQAMQCSPNDQLFVREAGCFHYTKGDNKLGQKLLAQAVAMDRKDIMALYYYSRSLADNGNVGQAIEYIREVLRQIPEDSDIHEYLARLYGQQNDLFQANLHMAYSGLYSNNRKKVDQFHSKLKSMALSSVQKDQLDRFDAIYKERKEFWK